jgi:CheY-like chemotaxis protein
MSDPAVVLLIEDERQIRRFVRTALEGEGWVVHEAATLQQGLAATRRRPATVRNSNIFFRSIFTPFLRRALPLQQCFYTGPLRVCAPRNLRLAEAQC